MNLPYDEAQKMHGLMQRHKVPVFWGSKKVRLGKEEQICIDFADRLRFFALGGRLKCVFTHIANEGKRSLLVALIAKAMGMIPGAADYLFCWADGSGFIEIKADKGKQTDKQKYFEWWCKKNGVKYALCYSAEEALSILDSWGVIIHG